MWQEAGGGGLHCETPDSLEVRVQDMHRQASFEARSFECIAHGESSAVRS